MELAAQRAKPLLEIGRADVQRSPQAEKREVIGGTAAERQNLAALRTKVRVEGGAGAALPARLHRWRDDWGRHTNSQL